MKTTLALMALMTAGLLCLSLGLTGCKKEIVEVDNNISLKQ